MRHTTTLMTSLLCLGLTASPVLFAEIALNPPATAAQPATAPTPQPAAEPAVPATAPPPALEPVTTALDSATISDELREKIKDAVVKIHVVQHIYEALSPWNSDSRKGSGSGLLIEGNLILTNAHVAADATFIEIQRHGETKRYEADVVYISHESDLAILRTKDANAYKGIKPLELGDLPKMQQSVEVYGFPIGGNTLSVTRGVVSRIEKQNYVHTGENLMAAQVDAAINFGNSGGPVISGDKVVGVAMQSGFLTENIGYMIPTPIIRHVLDDMKDGKIDGYGFHGFMTQSLENPAMRRKYGMNDEHTGILVHKIYKQSPADGKVQVGDIVTEIDGHKIENNGTVEFRPGEFIDHTHYIDMHQIGEDMKFKILRKGQPMEISIHLDKPGKEYLLVKPKQYDKQPSYFIFGGLVFMPLNQDVIDGMEGTPARIGALTYESPDEKRSEPVIMTKVLPADINKDYHHDTDLLIEKINGESIRNFREFFDKIQSATSDFITLETPDAYQLVIDRKEAVNSQASILARYGITNDRSKDLTGIQQAAPATTPTAAPASTPATQVSAPAASEPIPAVPTAPKPADVAQPVPATPVAPATPATPTTTGVAPVPAMPATPVPVQPVPAAPAPQAVVPPAGGQPH
ncbi:MAG TPA: serine protease [Candidatus Thiothrix moscowensis]|uniref:S1C family serine protease n=1 Tax=unclassified Thiothrix TaxID=2636184 RepID=UPI0025ECD0C7|nr:MULTISPECIES: serine protease [unclassified Thiothrix]HRJ51476.1 serine protease [Candidatus Thiothrix moscowensis]HRJ91469.1 serine protease [Candidatus Thiothrix moscowensis]